MNKNFCLAGVLAGVAGLFGGYILAHSNPVMADASTATSPVMMATGTNSAGQEIVYILKSEPAEDAALMVYTTTGKGDLELKSVRRITWDMKVFSMGGVGKSPQDLKKEFEQK
jgi:hypothetical protein